jgi:hypothetical protein
MLNFISKILPSYGEMKIEICSGIIILIVGGIITRWKWVWIKRFFSKIFSRIKIKLGCTKFTLPIPTEPFVVELQSSNCDILVNREQNISKIEIWITVWGLHFEPITISSVAIDVSINNGNFLVLKHLEKLHLIYSNSQQLVLVQDLSDKQERRAEQLFHGHEDAFTHLEFTINYEIGGIEKRWFKGKNVNLCWRESKGI